ncbi:hypothetical protein T09_386 [Trichinella sp. T9]|nr:hypothetical protein T09_386 [Trichinella sp. T9]
MIKIIFKNTDNEKLRNPKWNILTNEMKNYYS